MTRQPRREIRQHPVQSHKRQPRPFALWPGWTVLAMLAVIGALTAGGVVLVRSGYFEVQRVEITGTQSLAPQRLAQRLHLEGQSMLEIDEEAVRTVLSEEPLVASVALQRQWPSTVRITVTERVPWGHWQVGDALYVVDRDGVVIEGVQAPPDAPLIVQTDRSAELRPGDRVDASAIHLVEQLTTFRASRVEQTPVSFDWEERTGLVVVTKSGQRVVFGDAQDFDAKLGVWSALLDEAATAGIVVEEIDLRFGSSPAIRG